MGRGARESAGGWNVSKKKKKENPTPLKIYFCYKNVNLYIYIYIQELECCSYLLSRQQFLYVMNMRFIILWFIFTL